MYGADMSLIEILFLLHLANESPSGEMVAVPLTPLQWCGLALVGSLALLIIIKAVSGEISAKGLLPSFLGILLGFHVVANGDAMLEELRNGSPEPVRKEAAQ